MSKAPSKKAKAKQDKEWTAPFLPSLSSLPDMPQLVQHVAKYPDYQHNAKTMWSNDEAKCFEILERRLVRRQGKKRIARECGCSKWSVDAVVIEAEERGILAPWKERVSEKLGAIIEDGLDELHERIEAGSIADNVLPVVVGIAFDKKEKLDGGGLPAAPPAPTLNVEALNLFFTMPPENQSDGLKQISPANAALPSAGFNAGATLPPPSSPIIDLEPAAPAPGPGEGDREILPGHAKGDGSPFDELIAKGLSTPKAT